MKAVSTGEVWSAADRQKLEQLVAAGASEKTLVAAFPGRTAGAIRGRKIKWQLRGPLRVGAHVLPADDPAVAEARTIFPERVRDPLDAPVLLVPGGDQRKIGGRVEVGPWAGWPIFTLTLEERATCPTYCASYRSCMGNAMQWAARNIEGPALERRLGRELAGLQRRHPAGFVVRAHILGDFYSTAYVRLWRRWLGAYPALHVFGYTAWDAARLSPIGEEIAELAAERWDRFAVRVSGKTIGRDRAITIGSWTAGDRERWHGRGVVVCPQELDNTRGCGTCGLCWRPSARDWTIGFIEHGRRHGRSVAP